MNNKHIQEGQHTPGPWHVEPKVSDHGASLVICDGGGEGILAVIPPLNDADEPDADTAERGAHDEANSRLMAAAPDLLAALEGLIVLVGGQSWAAVDKARAAIAKAKKEGV